MNRRSFLKTTPAAAAAAAAPLGAQTPDFGKSKMKITGIRLSVAKPRVGTYNYKPAPGAWITQDVEVANPMSIYPKYKATRSLFNPDPGKLEDFAIDIATDKGISGHGVGGRGGGLIVEDHLTKLLMGEDPFDVERLWDIIWRSTMSYGRKGVTMNAISGVDIALWDIIGKALNMPVYKLLGGQTKDRIPCYCTGNDFDQQVKFGFKRLKAAIPHGPADGLAGMKKNEEVVGQARKAVGPEGDLVLDCWMSWTERYTIGEHEYGRYGFRELLEHEAAEIWQPDAQWCGG